MSVNRSVDPVELLRRQYLQCVDPESLVLPKSELLRLPEIQSQIYTQMFDESRLKYPPPERYSFRVLKRIVAAMEEAIEDPEEDEISDDISESMARYMARPLPSATAAAQQKSYVTYIVPSLDLNAPSVTLLEARALLASSGTTGFRTWEAALHLASFLSSAHGRPYVQGKGVLELGAGTGFLSIFCAAHLGASKVLATDGNNEVVNDLKANMDLNGLRDEKRMKATTLQWGHALIDGVADCRKEGQVYDLILGADVTYDVQSIPALVATLRDIFELYPRSKVLVSATIRNEDTIAVFLRACDANHFTREVLSISATEASQQIGFFHPTSTPINVFSITMNRTVIDPCSLK